MVLAGLFQRILKQGKSSFRGDITACVNNCGHPAGDSYNSSPLNRATTSKVGCLAT
jgi:hypothetical protein